MLSHRHRPVIYAVIVITVAWVFALVAYRVAGRSRVTAEKIAAYVNDVDLNKLAGEERAKAIRDLATMMTALSIEERRKARLTGRWKEWFNGMSEQEKSDFIESTMPSGFKQMLTAFEQLPEDKRKEAINRSMRDLRRARQEIGADLGEPSNAGTVTNRPPEISPELQQKVVKIGLKSFYSESSAQTKAELAPLLEEMQRAMESGALFHAEER